MRQIHIIASSATQLAFDLGSTYIAMGQIVTVWIPLATRNETSSNADKEREMFTEFGGLTRQLSRDFSSQIGPQDQILCL
ncbi:MAG: hypothetical protein RI942_2044 [Pseudomonadota bacterium]